MLRGINKVQDHVVRMFPSIHSSVCVENSLSGYTPKYQQWLPLRLGFRGKGGKVFRWTFNFYCIHFIVFALVIYDFQKSIEHR